jgi:hypothetical protein
MDLPDDMFRALKARAALSGVPLRELVRRLLEQGLHVAGGGPPQSSGRHSPPPVIIPPRGVPIPAVPRATLRRMDEEEDEAKNARSS